MNVLHVFKVNWLRILFPFLHEQKKLSSIRKIRKVLDCCKSRNCRLLCALIGEVRRVQVLKLEFAEWLSHFSLPCLRRRRIYSGSGRWSPAIIVDCLARATPATLIVQCCLSDAADTLTLLLFCFNFPLPLWWQPLSKARGRQLALDALHASWRSKNKSNTTEAVSAWRFFFS